MLLEYASGKKGVSVTLDVGMRYKRRRESYLPKGRRVGKAR